MRTRPLSPHLQVWLWGPHMLVSILHRVSGSVMAFGGLPVLVWWLGAMASGPDAYATFQMVLGSPLGLLVLAGVSWAFFNHMTSGLRHFVLDIGAGYELASNKAWSVASPVIGIALTAAFWAAVVLN